MILEKQCPKCDTVKDRSEYHVDPFRKDGIGYMCKPCSNAKARLYRRAKVAADPLFYRKNNLRNFYGMTMNDYNLLLSKQDGTCAICSVQTKRTLHVDHDHTSGKIRGLLCGACNLGIGKFTDSPELLRAAATYLEGA